MKHNTHIYLAAKAIELSALAVDNTKDENGAPLAGSAKTAERLAAKERERLLQYYKGFITEATWAPDDVLKDNHPFHVFKLFAQDEFPGHGLTGLQSIVPKEGGPVFYRFSGGLPYRVDHMAEEIINMEKLRAYNDQYELRQILYKYLLISHYVADAHVPNHCDLRDDPPTAGESGKPAGKYMQDSAHGSLETLWDEAVTPVALAERVLVPGWDARKTVPTDYSKDVTFTAADVAEGGAVRVRAISRNKLMEFMIETCVASKRRARDLFPVADPSTRNDDILHKLTRDVFAEAIGDLLSVWRYIWTSCR
jgi:hypothetical protein